MSLSLAELDLKSLVVGIDPGKATGVAVWCPETNEFEEVASFSFWEAVQYLDPYLLAGMVGLAVVEDSRKTGLFRQRLGGAASLIGAKGRSLGRVDRDCLLWIQLFHRHEIPVIARSTKNKAKKVDAQTFRNLTGWKQVTNKHGRDAGMNVFGLNGSHVRSARIDKSIEKA